MPFTALPNTIVIDVRSVPNLEEAAELTELIGTEMSPAEFIESKRLGDFLPLELQKIAAISILNVGASNKKGESFFQWIACAGDDEQAMIEKALNVIDTAFSKSKQGEYPIIVTHDGGRHALRLLTKRAAELYMEERALGEPSTFPETCKRVLVALRDDSDKWGNRKPNYLNARGGQWSADLKQGWGGGLGEYLTPVAEEMYFKTVMNKEDNPVIKRTIMDLLYIKEKKRLLDRKRAGLEKNCELVFTEEDEEKIIGNVEDNSGMSFENICELSAKITLEDFKERLIDNELSFVKAQMPDMLMGLSVDKKGKSGDRALKIHTFELAPKPKREKQGPDKKEEDDSDKRGESVSVGSFGSHCDITSDLSRAL